MGRAIAVRQMPELLRLLEPFREVSIPDQHVQARRRSMRRIIARRTNAAALRA